MIPRARLDEPKQARLNELKREVRVNNELYLRAHPELKAMTEAFVHSLLRQKPADVRSAACSFFCDPNLPRALGYDGWTPRASPLPDAEAGAAGEASLEQDLVELFLAADADGSGVLDAAEFAAVLRAAELGLSEAQIASVMAETETNRDGLVSWREFVPVACEVLDAMRVRDETADALDAIAVGV